MTDDVTQILQAAMTGCGAASEKLLPLVYEDLRHLAARKLAGEPVGQTLEPTALVHEAYLRMTANPECRWENRHHFFAAAAETMRRILVDRARRKQRLRHGGPWRRVDLRTADAATLLPPSEMLELNEALEKLEREDPEKAKLVTLRFFGGLTSQQAADLLGISKATADRHWNYVRAWLYREIAGPPEHNAADRVAH